ncbi:DNA adenine methylase [Helicobacter sp. MIT 14-3879]|uniref:DNA adenine methylase n=1 Tax=Helicobacter sp. MIT 14-3879 TaxID=2040649 RepID=UPI000E1F4525|nr:DNA adenine methylase [Helicobacter sp. MIT 14-3879]RDU61284.1 DNA methyltransferase [Helicobacter sp. MIT 14-3879]
MFHLSSRRYTGAKTKLLNNIDLVILKHFDYTKHKGLSFFDVFAGTGVVSEFFTKKPEFRHFIINDFLYANYVIYQGFFSQKSFSYKKLQAYCKEYQSLNPKQIKENYYSKHFGDKFFSHNDSKLIGEIRENLDLLLGKKHINQKEFTLLLASLLYSADRVANTVGHYDAYRKNIILQDRFKFTLIEPLKSKAEIEIFREDSNALAKRLREEQRNIDIAFIDPPYNSRQYSRFYHLLENLSQNKKPKLYGVALKPEPENLSRYCKIEAKEAFRDLIENLSKIAKILVVTYNNTYGANARSNARLNDKEIKNILESIGKTSLYEFKFKAFSSGKTDFKNHKERIFICQTLIK